MDLTRLSLICTNFAKTARLFFYNKPIDLLGSQASASSPASSRSAAAPAQRLQPLRSSPVPFSPITGGRDAARPRRAARRARLHRLRRVQVAPPSLPNPTYFLPRVTPLLGLAGT